MIIGSKLSSFSEKISFAAHFYDKLESIKERIAQGSEKKWRNFLDSRPCVLLATARPNGNTQQMVKTFFSPIVQDFWRHFPEKKEEKEIFHLLPKFLQGHPCESQLRLCCGDSSQNSWDLQQKDSELPSWLPIPMIHLDALDLAPHAYPNVKRPEGDLFFPLMEMLMAFEVWIFATPVYWYSYSGVLKNFFDNFALILKNDAFKKALKGKKIMMLSTSANGCPSYFHQPLRDMCQYLSMDYQGGWHTLFPSRKESVHDLYNQDQERSFHLSWNRMMAGL